LITYLKLGGSLITDKLSARTACAETIRRLADEIQQARIALPDMQLILGHGSGSFGHIPADEFHTRDGVHSPEDWLGFVEVWRQARDLNQIMLESLTAAGIPVMSFPPSAILQSNGGKTESIQTQPLLSALEVGIVPLVAGDVIFDRELGGTIFSTEDVFLALAPSIPPDRVLVCGIEAGVWQDYPANTRLLPKITPALFQSLKHSLGGSSGVDVTGGMRTKVDQLLNLVSRFPQTQAVIFSGTTPGTVYAVLMGQPRGTLITFSEGDGS
jgi:isopentenyl phosphate kinase